MKKFVFSFLFSFSHFFFVFAFLFSSSHFSFGLLDQILPLFFLSFLFSSSFFLPDLDLSFSFFIYYSPSNFKSFLFFISIFFLYFSVYLLQFKSMAVKNIYNWKIKPENNNIYRVTL